mmetsp:Transcript_28382/g.73048  ORF Transcript_28382/g.73048 Transcript_28382/m.73048 type:complete len:116 (-) Transcript_28382:284-631(-)
MAMNQELIATNQQLLRAVPDFLALSQSHEVALQQLEEAKAQLKAITQERDVLLLQQVQSQGTNTEGKEASTAEQRLLLTRKVSGIMRGVLQSEMSSDAKTELSMAITEMLQLLLQ